MTEEYNSRQTAFPGIFIKTIKVEEKPFDKKGVIQEAVGRAWTKEFEPLQKAGDVSEDFIQDNVEGLIDNFGPTSDEHRIKYELLVKAAPMGNRSINRLQERAVSGKARIWARAKNPFSTRMIEVSQPVKNRELSGEEIGDVYDVTVTVVK